MLTNKKNVVLISSVTAAMLAIVKLVGGVLTGSVSVIASAVDSILDIGTSLLNYFAIKKAEQPPDNKHRYGHGKFESLASLFQSGFIIISGLYILYEAYHRFISGEAVKSVEGGIWVMLFSLAVTLLLVALLRFSAKKNKSSILKTESLHYEIDLLTGGGILLGLVLVKITGINAIDPCISVLVALKAIYSAFALGKDVSGDLLDKSLSEKDNAIIADVMAKYSNLITDWHHLRTRAAGAEKFVDMHVMVNRKMTVENAHLITDYIEKDISETLGSADVQIHIEPCEDDCEKESCLLNDKELKEELEKLHNK